MLKKQQVETAVDATLALLKKQTDSVNLIDHPRKIDVQFTMKKIPDLKHKKFLIEVPNSIHHDLREVCLFVKDLDKKSREYEATVKHYEELLSKDGVTTITKIVPLKALRTDYSLPSNKVSLAKAYDLYLGDECIMGLLPGILGKVFYSVKRRVPIQVRLGAKDLKKEIERVVNNTRCVIQGTGSSCEFTVANDQMNRGQIVDNVLAACKELSQRLPGGEKNIRNMYLKGPDTGSVPLYINIDSANKVQLPKPKEEKVASYVDEITTIMNHKVMVSADGKVQVIKGNRKRKGGNTPNETDNKKKVKKTSNEKDQNELEVEIKEELAEEINEKAENKENDSDEDNKNEVQAEIEKLQKNAKKGKGIKKKAKDRKVVKDNNKSEAELVVSNNDSNQVVNGKKETSLKKSPGMKGKKEKSEVIESLGKSKKAGKKVAEQKVEEVIDPDNDKKEDLEIEGEKTKKGAFANKKQKKRRSVESLDDSLPKSSEKKKKGNDLNTSNSENKRKTPRRSLRGLGKQLKKP